MDNIKRYIIQVNGSEVNHILIVIALAKKLCKECKKNTILLIPTKIYIQNTTLETALGTINVKNLLKEQRIKLCDEGNSKLETQKTFHNKGTYDIIIGVYVTEEMIDIIDSAKNALTIIIPWIMDKLIKWRKTWNSQIIGV
jgi:hypothetical protein